MKFMKRRYTNVRPLSFFTFKVRGQGQDFEVRWQGLVNWSSRTKTFLEDNNNNNNNNNSRISIPPSVVTSEAVNNTGLFSLDRHWPQLFSDKLKQCSESVS